MLLKKSLRVIQDLTVLDRGSYKHVARVFGC